MFSSILFLIFLLSQIAEDNSQIFRYGCRNDATFKLVRRDTKLIGTVLSSTKVKSVAHCVKTCIDKSECKSINYNTGTIFCEALKQASQEVGEANLKSNAGWKHYEPLENQEAPACRIKQISCSDTQKCVEDCVNSDGYKCVELPNIARGKPTADGPNYDNNVVSSRAVDGNTNTNWLGNSCTHTGCCSPMPWWRVDFGKTALIYTAKITNRGDCCGYRLSNFNIRIGESSQGRGDLNTAYYSNVGVSQGATRAFVFKPRPKGRYLFIQSNYQDGMTLCEVRVYGELM